MKEVREQQQQQGLYRSEFEHDNCGIGAVVNIKGKKTHDTVANALKIVEHLEHRAGKDAEGKTGDGGPRIGEGCTSELELAEVRSKHHRG